MSNTTVIWSCTTAWQKHMLLLPQTCDSQIYSSLSLWVTQRSCNALQLIHQVTRLQISCMLIHDLAVPHQTRTLITAHTTSLSSSRNHAPGDNVTGWIWMDFEWLCDKSTSMKKKRINPRWWKNLKKCSLTEIKTFDLIHY